MHCACTARALCCTARALRVRCATSTARIYKPVNYRRVKFQSGQVQLPDYVSLLLPDYFPIAVHFKVRVQFTFYIIRVLPYCTCISYIHIAIK